MPIIKSSKKRMKQDERRKIRNKSIERQTKTGIKKLEELIKGENNEKIKRSLPYVLRLIDRTVSKGVWHKNKAAREKSKLMKKLPK